MKKNTLIPLAIMLVGLVACAPNPAEKPFSTDTSSFTVTVSEVKEENAVSKNDKVSSVTSSSPVLVSEQTESSKETSSLAASSIVVSSQIDISSQTPNTVVEDPADVAEPNPQKTYEENVKKREARVKEYLKKHNIDPKTAGETGEKCPHCGKKIWNPNKYGLANPGYPDDYENSGYCTGWCAVQVG